MFNIYPYNGDMPEDEICYLVAKDGIYLKKNLGIIESITKVKNVSLISMS